MIRNALGLLFFVFICKVAFQAQSFAEHQNVPKALLLGSLAPAEPIPSSRINTNKIIAAIRRE